MERKLTKQEWRGVRAIGFVVFAWIMYMARAAWWPFAWGLMTIGFFLAWFVGHAEAENKEIDVDAGPDL